MNKTYWAIGDKDGNLDHNIGGSLTLYPTRQKAREAIRAANYSVSWAIPIKVTPNLITPSRDSGKEAKS